MKKDNWIAFVPFYLLVMILCIGVTQLGSRIVTTVARSQPMDRRYRIIVDAGHGGVDGGATSCTGVLESHINLQIALRLDDLLHLLGYETVMIRTEDISVYTEGETIAAKKISDLKERVRIINDTENALLISIHQNTFSDSRYYGAQVFYSEHPESQQLARFMQTALVSGLNPESNRKTKKAEGVYLMEQIRQPGILIECGFLSNPAEEAKLLKPAYQKKLCCVIASVISQYSLN